MVDKIHAKAAVKAGVSRKQDPFKKKRKKLGGPKDTKNSTDHITKTTTVKRIKLYKQTQFQSPTDSLLKTTKGRPLALVIKQISNRSKGSQQAGIAGLTDIVRRYGPNIEPQAAAILKAAVSLLKGHEDKVCEAAHSSLFPLILSLHPSQLSLYSTLHIITSYLYSMEFSRNLVREVSFLKLFINHCGDLLDTSRPTSFDRSIASGFYSSYGILVAHDIVQKNPSRFSHFIAHTLNNRVSESVGVRIVCDVTEGCIRGSTDKILSLGKALKGLSVIECAAADDTWRALVKDIFYAPKGDFGELILKKYLDIKMKEGPADQKTNTMIDSCLFGVAKWPAAYEQFYTPCIYGASERSIGNPFDKLQKKKNDKTIAEIWGGCIQVINTYGSSKYAGKSDPVLIAGDALIPVFLTFYQFLIASDASVDKDMLIQYCDGLGLINPIIKTKEALERCIDIDNRIVVKALLEIIFMLL